MMRAFLVQGGYPLGDKAAMVADVYLRTVATMDKLRETLRDEHSFLIQVSKLRRGWTALSPEWIRCIARLTLPMSALQDRTCAECGTMSARLSLVACRTSR